MIRAFCVSLVLLGSPLCCFSQAAGNYQYGQPSRSPSSYDRGPLTGAMPNPGEVVLKVNGLMNIVADNYIAVFNLTQVAGSAAEADSLVRKRIADFSQKLRGVGIDAGAVTVDMLSLVPRYDVQTEKKLFSKTYNEVPAGFELQKNVMVRYRKAEVLDAIVTAAAAAEIYDLVKVDYAIASHQRALDTLRTACIQAMKAKVKSFEALGVRLDTQNRVLAEAYNTAYPSLRYAAYQAASRPSLSAAGKRADNFTEAARSTTRYYEPVSYDGYDLVLNPLITEPVVQLSYTLTLRYSVPDERTAPLQILTPNGELREVPRR